MISMILGFGLIVQSFGLNVDAKTIDLSKRGYTFGEIEDIMYSADGIRNSYFFNEGLLKICKYKEEKNNDDFGDYDDFGGIGSTAELIYGFIDKKGKEVIKPEWNEVGICQEGLIPARKKEDWFILNKKGETMVELGKKYDYVYDFSDGLAVVRKGYEDDGKYGVIDKEGKEIVGLNYDMIYSFNEGLTQVKKGKKWGIIDKKGKEIVKPKYETVWPCWEGVSVFQKGKKWGALDKKGKETIKPKFDALYNCREGFFVYRKGNSETGKYGFVDKQGRIVIKAKYKKVYQFQEGLATVYTDQGAGVINKKGKIVIQNKYQYISRFCEGRAAFVSRDGMKGFIDKKGKEIIKGKFGYIDDFHEGLGLVWGDKKGFVDKSGKMVFIFEK